MHATYVTLDNTALRNLGWNVPEAIAATEREVVIAQSATRGTAELGVGAENAPAWAYGLAQAIATAEVTRWTTANGEAMTRLIAGIEATQALRDNFTPEEWATWQRLADTLLPVRTHSGWPWWLKAMREDGHWLAALTTPLDRDALVNNLDETGVHLAIAAALREHGETALAADLESLVAFFASDATIGRWFLAWSPVGDAQLPSDRFRPASMLAGAERSWSGASLS